MGSLAIPRPGRYIRPPLSIPFPTVLGILAKEVHEDNIPEFGLRICPNALVIAPVAAASGGLLKAAFPPLTSPPESACRM